MALVVNQRGEARLVETPVYTPDRNVTTVRAEVTLQANGGATAHVTRPSAAPTRRGLRARLEAEATRVERVEDGLRDHFPGARVTAVRTGDLTRVDEPARVEYAEAAIPSSAPARATPPSSPPSSPRTLRPLLGRLLLPHPRRGARHAQRLGRDPHHPPPRRRHRRRDATRGPHRISLRPSRIHHRGQR